MIEWLLRYAGLDQQILSIKEQYLQRGWLRDSQWGKVYRARWGKPGRRGKSKSVVALSGGLPELGKRR